VTLFSALRHRAFALLWSGQTISRLGDNLYRIALAWWVLEKTGSATVMGTVLIFSMVPMLIFLLIGGVAVDRLPRGRVMLASDLVRGALVAGVAVLASANALEIWQVYIASVVFGFVSAFFQPAYTAIVPDIMPSEGLPSANALTNLSWRITGVAGPALGAFFVAMGGTTIAFALDAFSFFVSAACLVPVLGLVAHASANKSSNALRDLVEGVRLVFASPWLWITIVVFGFANMAFEGGMGAALPFLVKNNLHADVGELGLINSMLSLGSVMGAVWLGRYTRLRRRGWIAYGAAIIGTTAFLSFGLPITLVGVMIAAFIAGASESFFGLIWTNTLQELVPREMLGRVSSIDMLGSFVLIPVGFALAGWATDAVGAPIVFLVGGAWCLALFVLSLLHPAIRGLD
jgi:MFS family permease